MLASERSEPPNQMARRGREEIADDDAIRVPRADREPIDADDRGSRAGPARSELLLHVQFVEFLDGVPVEVQVLGDVLHGWARSDRSGRHGTAKGMSVAWVVGQEGERLPLHRATARAGHAPDLEVEVDPQVAAGEIPNAAAPAVVPPALHPAAGPTGGFFDRRVRVMIRAWGSPKIPVTVGLGRNPGKAIRIPQAARSSWRWHAPIMPDSRAASTAFPARVQSGVPHPQPLVFTHSLPRRPRFLLWCGGVTVSVAVSGGGARTVPRHGEGSGERSRLP